MAENRKKTAFVILGIIGIGVMLDVSGVTARLWESVFLPRRMFYESEEQFHARRQPALMERARRAVAPTPDSKTWTDPVSGMEFVFVPGGEFWMGSPDGEGFDAEHPRHQVRVNGFWMGKYEVTQAQWQAVMGNNPSDFKGADRPVEQVSWNDAQAFLQTLNAAWASSQSPIQFRLPSEAEWEYAARAGTQTTYYFGDDSSQLGDYAWFEGNSGHKTHSVGQKLPNAWGLYDMHGNVWEWCADTWHDNYNGAPTDGSAWGSFGDGEAKLLRGGSWNCNSNACRSAYRLRLGTGFQLNNDGFRVVAVLLRTQ